jgi:DNA-binding MarR family transcriptional regulator
MPNDATPPRRAADRRLVADRLHSAAIHLLRRLRRTDETTGLSGPKLSALSVIVHAGPIALGDLAAAEQVRPPTMTRVVQSLEDAGLVRRQSGSDDRRVTRIKATAAGSRLLRAGRNQRVTLLMEWIDELPNSQYAVLKMAVAVLEKLGRSR